MMAKKPIISSAVTITAHLCAVWIKTKKLKRAVLKYLVYLLGGKKPAFSIPAGKQKNH
jgi:hypothetical protein